MKEGSLMNYIIGELSKIMRRVRPPFYFKNKGSDTMDTYISKGILGSILCVATYLINCVNEILIVLSILVIIDYLLGIITKAILPGNWDKKISVRGAVKKIGYMICVLVSFLVDYVIMWLTNQCGIKFNTGGLFGVAVTCYFIGTEGLSILSHLHILGVPDIPFLSNAFTKLRDELSNSIDNTNKEEHK